MNEEAIPAERVSAAQEFPGTDLNGMAFGGDWLFKFSDIRLWQKIERIGKARMCSY